MTFKGQDPIRIKIVTDNKLTEQYHQLQRKFDILRKRNGHW